jgi:hypothetical protein
MVQQTHTLFSLGNRGGVGVRIVLIGATLAVVGAAIFWFLDSRQKNLEVLNRKAVEIGDYGLLQALARVKDNPSWTGKMPQTDYEGGWYAATAKSRMNADTAFLDVESVGHIGSISRKQECTLRLFMNASDSIWVRQSIK